VSRLFLILATPTDLDSGTTGRRRASTFSITRPLWFPILPPSRFSLFRSLFACSRRFSKRFAPPNCRPLFNLSVLFSDFVPVDFTFPSARNPQFPGHFTRLCFTRGGLCGSLSPRWRPAPLTLQYSCFFSNVCPIRSSLPTGRRRLIFYSCTK